jgi:hypothetical protein
MFDGVKSFPKIYQYGVQWFLQLLGSLGECTQNKKFIDCAMPFPKAELSRWQLMVSVGPTSQSLSYDFTEAFVYNTDEANSSKLVYQSLG